MDRCCCWEWVTMVHLAENIAGVRYRLPKQLTILSAGRPTRYHYFEIDHCCQNFNLLDRWLDAEGRQHRGYVGYAEARLARSRDIVGTALLRLHEDETTFLHPVGVDSECDEARASLAAHAAS
jgi:aminoglycoside 3-N-acetyltransferase